MRMTEAQYNALGDREKAATGLRIGRIFAIEANVGLEITMLNIRNSLGFVFSESWTFFESIFFARIPGWAVIKLGVTSAYGGISSIIDAFRNDSGDGS